MNSRKEINVPLNTCSKIFVQRDYSKGLGVQFDTTYPNDLQGKITELHWHHTITTINSLYDKAERVCCSTILETVIGCFSCYLSRLFTKTQYEKVLVEISQFLEEQNRKIYLPAGIHLTDPFERGLRVFEISLITTSPILHHGELPVQQNYALGLDGAK